LPTDALAGLGPVLSRAERVLREAYSPLKVIFYKLGFSAGFSCHFHIAPVTQRLMDEVVRHPDYDSDPDGNDAILFLSRVYCERPLSDMEQAAQRNTVDQLRGIDESITWE
jgi:diadenosine tetraphosphate (Ap4A) HIT family hydrolase